MGIFSIKNIFRKKNAQGDAPPAKEKKIKVPASIKIPMRAKTNGITLVDLRTKKRSVVENSFPGGMTLVYESTMPAVYRDRRLPSGKIIPVSRALKTLATERKLLPEKIRTVPTDSGMFWMETQGEWKSTTKECPGSFLAEAFVSVLTSLGGNVPEGGVVLYPIYPEDAETVVLVLMYKNLIATINVSPDAASATKWRHTVRALIETNIDEKCKNFGLEPPSVSAPLFVLVDKLNEEKVPDEPAIERIEQLYRNVLVDAVVALKFEQKYYPPMLMGQRFREQGLKKTSWTLAILTVGMIVLVVLGKQIEEGKKSAVYQYAENLKLQGEIQKNMIRIATDKRYQNLVSHPPDYGMALLRLYKDSMLLKNRSFFLETHQDHSSWILSGQEETGLDIKKAIRFTKTSLERDGVDEKNRPVLMDNASPINPTVVYKGTFQREISAQESETPLLIR